MSRRIIAVTFLIASIFLSIFASYKVQNVCNTATEKVENIIKVSETDLQDAQAQTEKIYEYWQQNSSILRLFVGTEKILNVKLSIYEMLFLLEQNNVEDFLEEAANCKRSLHHISEFEKLTLNAVL